MKGPRQDSLYALLLIVRRSLRQHALTTLVTAVACGLACGLVMAVWSLQGQTVRAFAGGSGGFDAVVGARGNQLQLVLNAVFHLETSPGNLPWSVYRSLAEDPQILQAVPLAVGDNYQGLRIAGTSPEFFLGAAGRGFSRLRVQAPGRIFRPESREVVLGSLAARRCRLKVGDHFHPAHGVTTRRGTTHEEEYSVVGVLAPTGTPCDRVIWAPIESVFHMSGHVLRGAGEIYEPREGEEIPEEHKEVSAVLLKLRSPQVGFFLEERLNRGGKIATLAWPIPRVLAEFFDKLGWANQILTLVAYLVMVVAAGTILTGIYNSMETRRRDLAVLRALGARRRTVFASVILEGGVMAAIGSLLGYLVCLGILLAAASILRARTGVQLEILRPHVAFSLVPPGMILLGILAGIAPAFRAYSTDVGRNLGDGG